MDEIDLNELMQLIIRDKGGTSQQYNQLMDYVAYHETGPEQRMDPKARQITNTGKKDGYGRGLFMFEAGEGRGGNAAANRLHNYFESVDVDSPKWLLDIKGLNKNVDATKLTANQQKMLFLGNHRMRTESNFSNIWSGKQSYGDFWQKEHWVGLSDATEEQKQIKLDSFNKSMAHKDSTEALKAREEELMYKQNMAPYLSDSNNINKLPQVQDILDGIFGAQDSSLVEEYDHGGVHLPTAESDATYVQQPQFNIPIAPEVPWADQFGSTSGTIYNPLMGNNPYNQWISGASNQMYVSPEQKQASQDYAQHWLGAATPIPVLEGINLTAKGLRIPGLIDDAILGPLMKGYKGIKGLIPGITKGGVPKTKTLDPNIKVTDLKLVDKPPVPTSTANINTYKAREIKNVVLKRKTYLLSDEYITKRAANTGESPNQIKAHIDTYLRELDNTTMGMYKEGDLGKNIKGTYGSEGVKINKDMSYEEILGTIDHEVNHLLSPVNRTAQNANPHTNVLWKDKKSGKRLTDTEAQTYTKDLDFDTNPKWQAWEDDYAKLYDNYPAVKMEVPGDKKFAKYLNDPAEQQVRMVRYGEILKKNGWDGTAKGLTDNIIARTTWNTKVEKFPSDVRQLLENMKGAPWGSEKWYAQIKKTLPYAWGMAPVAATTLQE